MNCKDRYTLEVLAEKYGTDKLEHGYIPFYVNNLPEEPKRILEIGVKEGRSLAMWAEYFPNAEIHGLDLFEEHPLEEVTQFLAEAADKIPHVICTPLHKGNQCDWRTLELLRKFEFDVIIDDGSHNSRDQMMTFFGLFNGKHYFIEDLHCCREEFYRQGLPVEMTAEVLFDDVRLYNQFEDFSSPDITFSLPSKIVCIKTTQ